jgi:N-acetylglucosaminyldiphosphoundecaprenol N-acetyl-beta-D-mannosaminyltransferase
MTRLDLRGCPVDPLPMEQLVALLGARMRAGVGPMHHHVSLNAAKWVALRDDAALRACVRSAGTVCADGVSIAWAVGAPERVPGVEVAERLVALAACEAWPVALVGARPEVVAKVAGLLTARGARVVVTQDGFFAAGAEAGLAQHLAEARPRLLLLALGTPKAERFVARWAGVLAEVPVVMGVGGAFDVWAGVSRRAPPLVGRLGLEWAWRFAESPRVRFGRAIGDSLRFLGHAVRGTRLP